MIDDEMIARLESLFTKINPAPWSSERLGAVVADVQGRRVQVASAQGDAAMHGDHEVDVVQLKQANADFIALARNVLPELLFEIVQYQESVRRLTEERDEARAEASRAEHERDLVRAEIDRRTDWYQQRFHTLREWVNSYIRPVSEEAYQQYWNIAANGSPAPHERADWTLTMHGLTMRAEAAEHQRDMAREEVERLLLERNAAFDDNARLRSALRSCADIGEARVAKLVRDALTRDFEKPEDSVVTAGDLIGLRRT